MPNSALASLRDALHRAWSGDSRAVRTQPLVELTGVDVARPAALVDVLRLSEGEQVRAVIGLVEVEDSSVSEAGFTAARDTLRRIAHYLAIHLNPPSLADDAQLWAVAPAGTNGVEAWMRLRAEVHQDAWSLPKSVWLPDEEPDPESFLREGPLARPWDESGAAQDDQLQIDARFARKLGTKHAPWDTGRVAALLMTMTGVTRGKDPETVAEELLQLAEKE